MMIFELEWILFQFIENDKIVNQSFEIQINMNKTSYFGFSEQYENTRNNLEK